MRIELLAISASLLLSSSVALAASGGQDRLLNNEGLVVLAHAGYNERFLVELIQSQPGRFDTSVEGLVYLAKQGISEKLVRLVIAEQKAAERAAAGEAEDQPQPHAKTAPVRMKVVTRKMLVPAGPALLGPDPVIVVEKRALGGDRYYALPGAQAPLVTPVATPRAPQPMPLAPTTRVAAFH